MQNSKPSFVQGGRRGEIYAGMKAIRDQYGDLVAPALSRHSAPSFRIQPELSASGEWISCGASPGRDPKALASPSLEAICQLVESPPERVLLVIGCRDVFECADLVPEVLSHQPIGLEGHGRFAGRVHPA